MGVLAWRLGSGPPFAVTLGIGRLRVNLRAGSCSGRIRERAKRWTRNWAAGAASSLRQAGPDGTTDSNRSKLPRGPRPGVRRPRLSCTQDACTEEDAQCRHYVRGGRRVRPGCWRKRMFGGAKSGYELRVAAQHNAEQPPGDGERALMGWRGRGWPLAHRPGSGRAKKERPRRSADG